MINQQEYKKSQSEQNMAITVTSQKKNGHQ